jgi:hypothetical protein
MSKRIISWAVGIVALALPLHGALALSSSITGPVKSSLIPVFQLINSSAVQAKSKVYTVKKYNFTITLPSNWTKITPPSGSIFAAQPTADKTVEVIMSTTKYSTQKQANTAKTNLITKSKDFGNYLLTSFQTQFPTGTCTLGAAKKYTLGGYVGAWVSVNCTMDTTAYTFAVFAFVHQLNYFSMTYVGPQIQYNTFVTPMRTMIKSIKFK